MDYILLYVHPMSLIYHSDVHHVHHSTCKVHVDIQSIFKLLLLHGLNSMSLLTGASHRCWLPVDRATLQKD